MINKTFWTECVCSVGWQVDYNRSLQRRSLLKKMTFSQLLKKFLAFSGKRRCITVSTIDRH